jgi:DNA-binding SARP family transcriptional activator
MPSLIVKLFGQFSVVRGDRILEDSLPGKAKELFCYLLLHQQRPISREVLSNILWAENTAERSRKYLRKALWQLQHALAGWNAVGVLHADSQWVHLKRDALWVDAVRFERAFAQYECAPDPLGLKCIRTMKEAVDMYSDDLLEGWYQDWCLQERERLQNIYLTMLDRLLIFSEKNQEYDSGMRYAHRVLICDGAHEKTHQHLMRLHYWSGDRAGALRQYKRCAAILKQELGVEPAVATRELYRLICEDRLAPMTPVLDSGSPEHDEHLPLLSTAFQRLENLRVSLAGAQTALEDILRHLASVLPPGGQASKGSR